MVDRCGGRVASSEIPHNRRGRVGPTYIVLLKTSKATLYYRLAGMPCLVMFIESRASGRGDEAWQKQHTAQAN